MYYTDYNHLHAFKQSKLPCVQLKMQDENINESNQNV